MGLGQMGFDWHPPGASRGSTPGLPPAAGLAARLAALAARGIFVGTSSWKYPGWLGQVYDPARYSAGNRYSRRKFERECLAEYATVFPTVCGDFAFYQFPSPALWASLFTHLPEGFRFSLKVPQDVTVLRFPHLPRYARRAGADNPDFMNAALVHERLLNPLEPYRDKLGVLIFEFGSIAEGPMSQTRHFAARLDELLSGLPSHRFSFAVEVRNPAFLEPESDYLACLREHGVAHCFNSWSQMPSVLEQMQVSGAFTGPTVAARFLLRPGRTYPEAVRRFAPYAQVADPYPEGREALSKLIERCLAEQRTLFAFVNNRLEGNAPQTIAAVTGAASWPPL